LLIGEIVVRLFVVSLALMAAGPAVAKECRMPDVPPGVRVQLPPGCDRQKRSAAADSRRHHGLRGESGFVDIGNGTTVRIGGRVRVDMGASR
jgi:hypothetical protein